MKADNSATSATCATKEDLLQELHYLRERVEQDAARILRMDLQSVAIRHELEQKRRGFALMVELTEDLEQVADYEDFFISISRRINAVLNMQRTAVLRPDADGVFCAIALQGYPVETQKIIATRRVAVDAQLLDPRHPVLVTGADPGERLASFRQALELPYLISCPLVVQNSIVALLVTGRLVEQGPFLLRLGRNDMETVQAVSAYLATILARSRLRQAENLANYDTLTQLPNLRKISELLRDTLAAAQNENYLLAVMFVDLDGFKSINDSYGHAAGDLVLRAVSERLRHTVRESDYVGRIGGDEFIVILSRISTEGDAELVAVKILEKLSQVIQLGSASQCRVGASIGIAVFPHHGRDASSLLDAADLAMYSIKNTGKNGFAYAQNMGTATAPQ